LVGGRWLVGCRSGAGGCFGEIGGVFEQQHGLLHAIRLVKAPVIELLFVKHIVDELRIAELFPERLGLLEATMTRSDKTSSH
jgi:hypothetical protein